MKPTYWQRLKAHPGVGIATILSLSGFVIGASVGEWWRGCIMLVFWIPVLLTARTQPVGEE
jgi:hypothetical protein